MLNSFFFVVKKFELFDVFGIYYLVRILKILLARMSHNMQFRFIDHPRLLNGLL